MQISVAGGESSLVPAPFPALGLMDISLDHSQLLTATRAGTAGPSEFWALPLPSGPPRRIADVSGVAGTWSPNGRNLIFAKDSDVYLANADGTSGRKLFSAPNGFSNPHFSPDGSRVRFTSFKDNASSIWEVRADGTDLHPLLPGWRNPPSECCGVWSPGGRYYFFLSNTDVGGNIWALRESKGLFRRPSSEPLQLTAGPMLFGAMASSPDGKTLFADAFQSRGELARYDAASRQFVPFLSGISAGEVNFSRNGKWVAYVSYPERFLWRSRVDGSDRLQLTYPPTVAGLPHWSPDGTQIVFADLRAGEPSKIFLVPEGGGAPQEMLAENSSQIDAEWSPDGTQIVYGRRDQSKDATIQILDLSSRRALAVPGSEGLFAPRWFARRPAFGSPIQRLPQNHALRFQDSEVVRLGQRTWWARLPILVTRWKIPVLRYDLRRQAGVLPNQARKNSTRTCG